jgi:hypothetical protein
VQDLEVSDTTTLFAVIGDLLWFSLHPFTQWLQLPLGSNIGAIPSIALLRVSEDEEILFVATSKAGLLYVRLVGSYPATISNYNTHGYLSVSDITTMQQAPYPMVGIAPPSKIFVAPAFGVWIPMTLPVAQINCLAQSASSGIVLIGTNEGVYRYNGGNAERVGLQGRSITTLNTTKDNTFYAGTDDGFYRSRTDGASWTRTDAGTVLTAVGTPWVLLPPTIESGSSWPVTVVLDTDDRPHEITGRVLSVLDELVLPSGHQRYRDAVVVRYSIENPGADPKPGRYAWLAYFVRDRGLVWLEESVDGDVVGTSVLLP